MKYAIHPVGVIRSPLKRREDAPMQGHEGAPDVWAEIDPAFTDALDGIGVGDEVIVITWLHESHRDVLKVHPRKDTGKPLTGVFATRSPDRTNPLGLHRVKIYEIAESRLKLGPIEAIDGTPIVDIKPARTQLSDW